jgi:predicted phosphodiesterase
MRLALISDIHGNPIALEAVLSDARALGAEQFWILGDIPALGPEPTAVLERVSGLAQVQCTRGNTDRYVVTGDGPPPSLETVRENPDLIATYARIAASFAWTRGALTAGGWLEWIDRLSLEIRCTTPSGLRLLAVHASPGEDDGEGFHPGSSNAEIQALLGACDADVVIVGHTHEPMIRRVDRRVVINLGCVSNPRGPDLRASWVMLEVTTSGIEIEHRRVDYDHGAVIDATHRSRHPSADFIASLLRGALSGRPAHADDTPFVLGEKVRIDAARVAEQRT